MAEEGVRSGSSAESIAEEGVRSSSSAKSMAEEGVRSGSSANLMAEEEAPISSFSASAVVVADGPPASFPAVVVADGPSASFPAVVVADGPSASFPAAVVADGPPANHIKEAGLEAIEGRAKRENCSIGCENHLKENRRSSFEKRPSHDWSGDI